METPTTFSKWKHLTRNGMTANYIYRENYPSSMTSNHGESQTLAFKPAASIRTEQSRHILPATRFSIHLRTHPDVRFPQIGTKLGEIYVCPDRFHISVRHPKTSPLITLKWTSSFSRRIHAGPESKQPALMSRDVTRRVGGADRHDQTGDTSSMRMLCPEKLTLAPSTLHSQYLHAMPPLPSFSSQWQRASPGPRCWLADTDPAPDRGTTTLAL